MPEIVETELPGLGMRLEFNSEEGHRIGVIHHRTGRRELFVCTPSDPDSAAITVKLSDDESHALADALGGSSVVESLSAVQEIKGLAIDWLSVDAGSPYADGTIGQAQVRTRTGLGETVRRWRAGRGLWHPGGVDCRTCNHCDGAHRRHSHRQNRTPLAPKASREHLSGAAEFTRL